MTALKLTSAILFLIPCIAFSEVVKHDSAWGESCDGAEDSYGIILINNLETSVDYRVCLEHITGSWTCFVSSDILSGELGTTEWAHSICDATGNSQWWWRDAGDYSVSFSNPELNISKEAQI